MDLYVFRILINVQVSVKPSSFQTGRSIQELKLKAVNYDKWSGKAYHFSGPPMMQTKKSVIEGMETRSRYPLGEHGERERRKGKENVYNHLDDAQYLVQRNRFKVNLFKDTKSGVSGMKKCLSRKEENVRGVGGLSTSLELCVTGPQGPYS
ncbi:hypothetical protein H5410_012851 [Solanum commersonii]|uniref:Uncharacterized protein n=1 Tax=Solanum commersonii TaxID=4109 RepID=A0A9J6ATI1_SOLCO|nr:hypothetical protein H5410_012851 [Solanum commersonii]